MSNVPAQFKSPALPQVNLMPPEVGARREKSRRRSLVVFFLAFFILLIAVAYVGVAYLNAQAQAAATLEAERTAQLQADIAALSEVDVVKAQLANSESARQYVAGVEMFWPLVLAAVDGAVPDDTQIQTIEITAPQFGASPPLASDAFGVAGVAQVRMTLAVPTYVAAADVEDSINTVPFFTRARATNVSADSAGGEGETGEEAAATPIYLVDVTFTITYDALMMRYSPRWFGTDEQGPSLEEYYQDYLDAMLAGGTPVTEYPPLPEVTPPPFIPGQQGVLPEPAPAPSPSASPSAEETS